MSKGWQVSGAQTRFLVLMQMVSHLSPVLHLVFILDPDLSYLSFDSAQVLNLLKNIGYFTV